MAVMSFVVVTWLYVFECVTNHKKKLLFNQLHGINNFFLYLIGRHIVWR